MSGCIQGPAKVIVIDHLPGHPSVDADIFPGDKSGLVEAEKEDHVGNIQMIADTTGGVL